MTNLAPSSAAVPCAPDPSAGPVLEALPGRRTELGGIVIRRLLPRSGRRLVGPWCFLDGLGPLDLGPDTRVDVPPHPHIGLQTVSWLLEGEILHHDSLGEQGTARPGVLNLMTAGRGLAHSEESPPGSHGRLHGVQLWVALPGAHRETEPSFEQHAALPVLERDGGRVTVIQGELEGQRSPARTFSPMVGAELTVDPGTRLRLELDPGWEHALVPLRAEARLADQRLGRETLYYLGRGRREIVVEGRDEAAVLLLIGGAPFGETILMWWNFVARTPAEIAAAREDWESGRHFGEVSGYAGDRTSAPPLGRLAGGA
jgi:redox-sensitive bicupin YhaK (pirin superfamily)